ncbi:MAG: hypothetical protein Q7O66_13650, partial [Dehalococcoidia bacterium]|nr:hypothetical protein [Dehalococcoidia bacterium]
ARADQSLWRDLAIFGFTSLLMMGIIWQVGSLNNVARHARTEDLTVSAWADQCTLGLHVEDRGPDFDVDAVLVSTLSNGIAGMYKRARLSGGRWTIESSPGQGTRLMAVFPINLETRRRRTRRV